MARSLLNRLAALEQSVKRTPVETTNTDKISVSAQKDHNHDQAPGHGQSDNTGSVLLRDAGATLEQLGFHIEDDGYGPLYVSRLSYDLLTRHGGLRFFDIMTCDLSGLEKATKARLNPEVLRFYDTETTGLGTGAGTFPFLHTVGEIQGDELVLYQYFVSDFSQEYAVLKRLCTQHFCGEFTLVTFNGKSYDWPLLKNRMVLYRIEFDALKMSHADLLYPARRLWKNKLTGVSLGVVEREVLGLVRVNDLPGKEAPNRYFQFTDTRDAGLMSPVFAHNASDVCSLVTLSAHISYILSGHLEVDTSVEFLALAKWYDEWQEYELADACFVSATQQSDADFKAYLLTSMYFKRARRFDEAIETWREMVNKFKFSVVPLIELAKYEEHQARNLAVAEEWASLALERTVKSARLIPDTHSSISDSGIALIDHIRHRLERIRNKRAKQSQDERGTPR